MVIVLEGRPSGVGHETYDAAVEASTNLMEGISNRTEFCFKYLETRRNLTGASIHNGVSTGNGLLKPSYVNPHPHGYIVDHLQQQHCFQTLASYGDGMCFLLHLEMWAPDLYHLYANYLLPFWQDNPELVKHLPYPNNSIFPAATYNFGPAQSDKHLDLLNVPYGFCDIGALGKFGAVQGHLVLCDLCIIIQFPAGSQILLPSTILFHSFTQYCAGIFRWTDAGHKLEKDLLGDEKDNNSVVSVRGLD